MSNFRSSLILLILVVGAGFYFYFIERHQKTTDEAAKIEKNLFSFTAEEVVSLKIISGDKTIDLAKTLSKSTSKPEGKAEGSWQINTPLVTEADDQAVNQVLDSLVALQSRRTILLKEIKDKPDLVKQSGLSPAATRIEISTGKTEKNKFILLLGRKTAVSDFVYARTSDRADAPVFLISTASREAIDKKLDDLRSRAVVSLNINNVTRVGLRTAPIGSSNPGGTEVEAALEQSRWTLVKPLSARADKKKIEDWLAQMNRLTVKSFVTEDGSNLNQFGLSTPASQIWIQSGDKNNLTTLLIGNPVPTQPQEVYAKRLKNDTVFTLPTASIQPLLEGLQSSRDKHLLDFLPESIVGIKIESKGKSLEATKENAAWSLAAASIDSSKPLRGDPAVIADFLRSLAGLEAVGFAKDIASDLKPFGLDSRDKISPKIILKEKKGEGVETLELLLGKADKQGVFAKNSRESFIYTLPVTVADKWPIDPNEWRNCQIIDTEAIKIQGLQASTASGPLYHFNRSEKGFATDVPRKGVNAIAATLLLNKVSQLRATRWLGPVQPVYGLAKPELHLTIQLESGESRELIVGSELVEGSGQKSELKAAQFQGDSDAFALSRDDVKDLLTSPLESVSDTKPANVSVPQKP